MNYPSKFGKPRRFCLVEETGTRGMGRVREKGSRTQMKRAFPTDQTDF